MAESQLVLFDIDGTMLLDDAYAHGRAMIEAMRSVYGAEIADDAVQRTQPWGKTDMRIAREALTGAGLDEQVVEAGRAPRGKAAGGGPRPPPGPAPRGRIPPGGGGGPRHPPRPGRPPPPPPPP